ncbi:MAG TPA: hypothetical protein VM012_01585 [Flavitalea sp.]|nr:hypothetical protein [Flavitalea sp.]
MRRILIGALVGGILLFVCQTLSWTVLNLHQKANQYTPKQTEILQYLGTQLPEAGQFYLPNHPESVSMDESMKLMEAAVGKPWAIISYHKSMEINMVMNMIRGLLVDFLTVGLLCWILVKINVPTYQTIFVASLFTGLIVFLNAPYTHHIWYQSFDLMAHFIDAIVGWGVVGLWLGYWLTKVNKNRTAVR